MADDLEQQYRALVERVRRYPMPKPAREAVLAQIASIYEAERSRRERGRDGGGRPIQARH